MAAIKPTKLSKIVDIHIEETIPRAFVLFLQTAYAVEKYAESELNKVGLSISKLMALQILETNGGTTNPSTIARWMLREKHNITTVVDRLSRDGLVRVRRGIKADRRLVKVTLTDKGRQALERARPVTRKIIEQIMASIDENLAASLEQQLKVLRLNAHQGMDRSSKS